jgi:hypothetical protein
VDTLEENKQTEIHDKGFSMYGKIKTGNRTLQDAVLDIETL